MVMNNKKYVSCYTCKNKTLIVAGEKASFWECRKTGFLFGPEELKASRQCRYYEPEPIYSLSDKEATLYNFLLEIDGPLIVDSIPPSYRGALGKLKKLGLIRLYNSSVKVKVKDPNTILNDRILYKNSKVVEVIGKDIQMYEA